MNKLQEINKSILDQELKEGDIIKIQHNCVSKYIEICVWIKGFVEHFFDCQNEVYQRSLKSKDFSVCTLSGLTYHWTVKNNIPPFLNIKRINEKEFEKLDSKIKESIERIRKDLENGTYEYIA